MRRDREEARENEEALYLLKEHRYNRGMTEYEKRVKELMKEGLTRSDAQGIADMEQECKLLPSDWANRPMYTDEELRAWTD